MQWKAWRPVVHEHRRNCCNECDSNYFLDALEGEVDESWGNMAEEREDFGGKHATASGGASQPARNPHLNPGGAAQPAAPPRPSAAKKTWQCPTMRSPFFRHIPQLVSSIMPQLPRLDECQHRAKYLKKKKNSTHWSTFPASLSCGFNESNTVSTVIEQK